MHVHVGHTRTHTVEKGTCTLGTYVYIHTHKEREREGRGGAVIRTNAQGGVSCVLLSGVRTIMEWPSKAAVLLQLSTISKLGVFRAKKGRRCLLEQRFFFVQ